MRSKTPLVLMEQLMMLLVFALASALCVQVFVLSDQTSRAGELRSRALLEAQNAAEQVKSCRGDWEAAADRCGGTWNGLMLGWSLDEEWQPSGETAAYHVLVSPVESDAALLGAAEVTVYDGEGQVLASLPVAWQEEAQDG